MNTKLTFKIWLFLVGSKKGPIIFRFIEVAYSKKMFYNTDKINHLWPDKIIKNCPYLGKGHKIVEKCVMGQNAKVPRSKFNFKIK